MTQTTKNDKLKDFGDENIINVIKKNVKKPEWIIIGGKKSWPKKCKYCNKIVYYNSLKLKKRSIKIDGRCRICILENPRKGWHHTEETKLKISEMYKGEGNPFFGKYHSEKNKKEYSLKNSGENNPMFGKYGKDHPKHGISKGGVYHHSNESKIKMSETKKRLGLFKGKNNPAKRNDVKKKIRLGVLKYIRENIGMTIPFYNKNACKYLDDLSKKKGWNLLHALNGGEYHIKDLGYFLDGYDEEKNIVVEYDEAKHYDVYGNLKEKDIRRQREIINELKCDFYRYNETKQQFYKV